ncbi:hypothetical protein [Bartonella saheliensis]|uniref:hypothetical protein n=1 Tax=Bartonella saheliensis TaxID=1457016 RepID=UPI0011A6BF40|nr:hypothetical protein [Bartonella saheliensis]
MAEFIPSLIPRKNTRVIGHVSDYTPEQLQELFSKNKERLRDSFTENKTITAEDDPHPSALGSFGWGALHGLTLGYDDELAGALAANPIDYWMGDKEAVKKYDEVTKRWRDYQKAADRDHFYLSLAGNVVGTLAGLLGPGLIARVPAGINAATRAVLALSKGRSAAMGAKIAGKALLDGTKQVAKYAVEKAAGNQTAAAGAQITSKALAAGERALQSALTEGAERAAAKAAGEAAMKAAASKEAARFSLGRAAKTGALYGAVAGSGEGEGLEDTVKSTLLGAGLGVATPYVASGLTNMASFATKKLKAALSGPISSAQMAQKAAQMAPKEAFHISERALREVSQTLGDEGVDKLERALRQRGPDAMMIDLHDDLATRAFKAAEKDSDASTLIRNRLNERQDASGARVKNALIEIMGPKDNTRTLEEAILTKAQKETQPFYERAKAAPLAKAAREELSLLQEKPAFQKAYQKAIAQMPKQAEETVHGSNKYAKLNMPILQKMKEVLEDQINVATLKGEWNTARDLRDVKQRLLSSLETSSPDYAKARKIYENERTIMEAFEQGKQALNKTVDLESINSQLAHLGTMEKEAFQKGVRAQIETAASNAQDFEHNLLNLFDTQTGQEKLQQIFGEDKAKQLMKMLRPEVERTKLFAKLPNYKGEFKAKTVEPVLRDAELNPTKAVIKILAGQWGRRLLNVHRKTERDLVALLTARQNGDFGLAREKAVELIKTFHEAEKKRLISKEDHTKFINLLGFLLNRTVERNVNRIRRDK